MALEKSEAIVLRVLLFRDTSKIVTAYAAEHGLVSLLAKGVRGPRPRFGAALEIFAHVDLVFYMKDSRELQLLSHASLLDAHLGLSRSTRRYAYGVAVLELLLKALSGTEPPGRLYALALRTLEVLESGNDASLPTLFRAFTLKAISFLGHRPELHACVECGGPVGAGAGFSPLQGGTVCAGCRRTAEGVMDASASALDWLRRFLGATLADLDGDPAPPAEAAACGALIEAFLRCHMERYDGLRSLRYFQFPEARRRALQ